MSNKDKTAKQLIDDLVERSKRMAKFEGLEEQDNQEESLQNAKERILSYIEKLKTEAQSATLRLKKQQRMQEEDRILLEELCVAELIRDVVNTFKEGCCEKDVKIHLDMPENPVVAVMHAEYLSNVLSEIIQNAIEASMQCGIIRITLLVADEGLTIKVYDQGSGIQQEFRSLIFEPFFTTKSGSMGIGLSVSKSMVEAMGGSIDFKSNDSETVFRVILPYLLVVPAGAIDSFTFNLSKKV